VLLVGLLPRRDRHTFALRIDAAGDLEVELLAVLVQPALLLQQVELALPRRPDLVLLCRYALAEVGQLDGDLLLRLLAKLCVPARLFFFEGARRAPSRSAAASVSSRSRSASVRESSAASCSSI